MASINKIHLLGRIGRVETITFADGNTIVEASLATTEKYKDRSGQAQEDTQWHNIVLRGKLAQVSDKYLHKGDLVYVEGRMTYRKYSGKDGVEKTIAEVAVSNVQFLSSKTDNAKESPRETAKAVPEASAAIDDDNQNDLPF